MIYLVIAAVWIIGAIVAANFIKGLSGWLLMITDPRHVGKFLSHVFFYSYIIFWPIVSVVSLVQDFKRASRNPK